MNSVRPSNHSRDRHSASRAGLAIYPQALVLMSGGVDSAACAHFLQRRSSHVSAIFIDYGQAARKQERSAAAALSKHLNIPLSAFRITGGRSFSDGELVGRNAFLAFSAFFLSRAAPGVLAMGMHAGTDYYDCSMAFISSLKQFIADHSDGKTVFIAPFIDWSKKDVFEYFKKARLPLSATYSCEAGSLRACGECLSCLDRMSLKC